MTAPHIVDPATVLGEALADASPDLMRTLLQTMINALFESPWVLFRSEKSGWNP
jgi:putative transposase